MNIRDGTRLVLLNDRSEVFLFRSDDLTRTDPRTGAPLHYWVTPGGGAEAGETWEDAGRRETSDVIFPVGLSELIAPVIAGHIPGERLQLLE